MEKLFNFVPLLYTNKSEIYNAPFLILRNTESCVSRRNKETRYAGVRCLLFHYTRYLIVIPHFFFFFVFQLPRDRCSTMRARFRVATSSFCFPREFPHSTPSISGASLKKSSYNYWFKKSFSLPLKPRQNENENFHFQKHHCHDLI